MEPSPVLPPPHTPPRRPPRRAQQTVGNHFIRPDALLLQEHLSQELQDLLHPPAPSTPTPDVRQTRSSSRVNVDVDSDSEMADVDDPASESTMFPPEMPVDGDDECDGGKGTPPKRLRRLHPDEATNRLYGMWLGLLPDLVPEYLTYL
ncbi:hypothetical protein C8Q76DRAFT_790446 [Earliella scabrosa]|nr:hypothetical protein C8Q76DRAFT_790446 [Earliella scabrosa]